MRKYLVFSQLVAVSILVYGLVGSVFAQSSTVAVFDDPAYVDTIGGSESESDAVQASLNELGHTVQPFVGITAAAFNTALLDADVLLIPELELDDLAADLSGDAINSIKNFVSNGGGLIIHGSGSTAINFLNTVFGFAITNGSETPNFVLNAAAAAGTAFEGGLSPLPNNSATDGIASVSLPPGSKIIYQDSSVSNDTIVGRMRFGSGVIIYLGWDWFDAAPLGPEDGGWLEVLNRAVIEAGVGPAFAVYRPGSGRWFFDKNQDGVTDDVIRFGGVSGDIATMADFDGDKRPDLVIFRPSNGRWYVDLDRDGITNLTVRFGIPGDTPLPGDYNGDGIADFAVFRSSTGRWYVDINRDGITDRTVKYGISTDIPVRTVGPAQLSLIQ